MKRTADDFAGVVMLKDGELDAGALRTASVVRDTLMPYGDCVSVQQFERAIFVGGLPSSDPESMISLSALKRPCIVFSGKIDNSAELERHLGIGRHGAKSLSDSGLVLRAFEAWGAKAVTRLHGAFSFVIYNPSTGQLFCARDRFGIRALHYLLLPDRIVFASRQALLAEMNAATRREADEDAVLYYLAFGHAPAYRSALKSFGKVKPGHRFTVHRNGTASEERYWQFAPVHQDAPIRSPERVAHDLKGRLDAIVARQGAGERTASVVLNGLPASFAVMQSVRRSGFSTNTPTVRFLSHKEGKGRRSPLQKGRMSLDLDAGIAALALSSIAEFDEPFGHVEAIQYQAFYGTTGASHSTFSGAGGDELLLAHQRYRRFSDLLSQPKVAMPDPGKQTFHQTKLFKRDLYGDLIGNFSDVQRFIMAGPALAHTLIHAPVDDLGTTLEKATPESGGEAAARIDLQHGAPVFLALSDFARTNNAPDPSYPFLDLQFADACAALPTALKGLDSTGENGGVLLSALCECEQPTASAPNAPARVPVDEWLRTDLRELMEDTFASSAFRSRDYFNLPWLDRLVRDHLAGVSQSGPQLWSLLCLESWLGGIQTPRTKIAAVSSRGHNQAEWIQ